MPTYLKLIAAIIICTGIVFSQSKKTLVPSDQPTIQAGIDASTDGDTVVVSPGRYLENIRFKGKKIVLTSRFCEQGDTSYIASTIIDGSSPSNPDSASVVLIVNKEDSTTVLQGFTITGGTGTIWADEHGAGDYREGGGILVAFSAPVIKNNLIINNTVSKNSYVTSAGGGGIRAGDGNPKILNNIITRNTGRYGAGIVLNFCGAIVRNNIITENSGGQDYGGGALWMNNDGPAEKIIENNTIALNNVLSVYVWAGTSTIRNCIIWRDSTISAVQIAVRNGGPKVTYSDIQGGWTGVGNISLNPRFSDSYCHLEAGSPCIDAGDTSSFFEDREDAQKQGSALWPSRGALRNDMGAYGGPGAVEFPVLNNLTGVGELKKNIPGKIKLYQNYPNPFNPVTKIVFILNSKQSVILKIYDILGREVSTLLNDKLAAGEHSIVWHADMFPSGIYFCRLQCENYCEIMKLLLIK